MKQIYCEKWSETVNSSHSKYVLSDRIPSKQVLRVHSCYAWAPEREVGDRVHLGVKNGGVDVLARARGSGAVKDGMSVLNGFAVGEGDQVFAYFPDADNTDTIELHLIGVLYSLDAWQKLKE